ncbi:Dedicator of cytokinesis protein 6 [Desmophyllum pertusum]|uniref:Dedicator of cytokinesis protein 6 n=1 Tax=Desmophyllum pertusum TaxID=174260 RepID=A0A9W9Z436_9CNID|nr:Dedicator of cytokinesis protein 6 [Desmophyllum pertusum]
MSPTRSSEGNLESVLRKSIVDLSKAREEPLVTFLYLVLDKLILLLVRPPVISGTVVNIGQAAFESLTLIVHRLHQLLENSKDEHGRNQLLASYVTYVFSAPYNHSPACSQTIFQESQDVPQVFLLVYKWVDDDEDPRISEAMNMPGNRNSMAETRPSSLSVPGLVLSSSGSRKLVHEELALQWAVASGPLRETAMAHAWFFF